MERFALIALLLLACTFCQAKSSRTYYDDGFMNRMKQKIASYDWARAQVEDSRNSCEWLTKLSDQELWDLIPPPEQMRAINVCIAHDCPNCGDEVNRKAGHYPWITSRELPFKVKCPVCGNVYPKNDFKPWNTQGLAGKPETGPEPIDNGIGWVDPKDGRRYWFVSYYIFWQRWTKDILGGLSSLRTAYLLTGEPIYAHKAAVMLAKIASEYERFDYPTQCYHEGMFGIRGRISDYIWSTGNDTNLALVYDAIFPTLADDKTLADFLQAKGLGDIKPLIEDKMLAVMVKDVMSGYVAGNMGMHQVTLATLGIVLDNNDPARGTTTKEISNWLMAGPGRIEDLLWNGFTREGLGAESAPGYASGWGNNFYEVAQLLPKLGVDIWSNPKLKKMADIGLDLRVAGEWGPDIGDCGGMKSGGPIGMWAGLQGPAFMHYRDPRHAQALVDMKANPTDLFDDYFDKAEVEKALAAGKPDMTQQTTRALGGYGVALLEAGQGDKRLGLSLYYGDAAGGHGHYDRLNVQMWADGLPIMPEDGYPTPFTRPDFYEWRRAGTYKHYEVMIDELPQMTLVAGHLLALGVSPEVQYAEASAEEAYPNLASLYRRTCALVDISPEQSYLLDLFRVRGGSQHDWCYHAGAPDMTITGGKPGPVQAKGTLAGENVPYGTRPQTRAGRDAVTLDLQAGQGVTGGDDYSKLAQQGWARHVNGILTNKIGSTMSLSFPKLEAGKYKLLIQYWDHVPGTSELELTLGKTVVPITIKTNDSKAYQWQGQIVDLPEPVETLKLVVKSSSINYVMINRMVLSTNLQAQEPPVANTVSSGFQGLFNVQRMKPQGAWSATWTNPDKKVSVTMTMPQDCAQEVIVADGEPEAQPGNPRHIKYALGRNVAEPSPDGLLSKFIAVIEPHTGPAAVRTVTTLQATQAAPETVGVQVQRAACFDLIHSALDANAATTWQGAPKPFTASGEFALVTVDEQGVQRAMLVNGTSISYGDFSLQAAPAPTGTVATVDFAHNAVTLDTPLPSSQACLNREIMFSNALHQTSFTIKSVKIEGAKTILGFGDTLFIAGMALAQDFDNEAGTIVTTSSLAGYGKTYSGRHQGRWLYNEDKSQAFRIKDVNGSILVLESNGADLATCFKDTDGDGRRQLWISDIGPGDAFKLPVTTFVKRVAPNEYQVETMTEVNLSVPKQ